MRLNGKDMFKLIPLILYLENVPKVVFIFVRSWKMRPHNSIFGGYFDKCVQPDPLFVISLSWMFAANGKNFYS